jgi:hypothetical protein
MRSTIDDLQWLYSLLARLFDAPGQGRALRELPASSALPKRGVYFFGEPGEFRVSSPAMRRIVRVGTHAVSTGSKSTLRGRLKQHLGTRAGGGNHRGSIFRLHLGKALLARDSADLPTWGIGSAAPLAVRESETIRAAEADWEQRVSAYIGGMTVCWIDVPDEPGPQSVRAIVERNAIALLSNQFAPIDRAGDSWLGRFSPRHEIRDSALWNLNYVADVYDPTFLNTLETHVRLSCAGTQSHQ